MPKRKCKNCGERKDRDTMFIPNTSAFCSRESAIEWSIKNQQKGRDKIKTESSKDLRELNRRTLSWQHNQTQTVFNRMRVLEEMQWFKSQGIEPTCISCGKSNMDWCCGHFKTRGSQSELRYDRKNTYLQCNRYCNKGLSGNIEGNKNTRGYKVGLAERFGELEAKEVISYCEGKRVVIWTCDELELMRKEFNVEIRRLNSI